MVVLVGLRRFRERQQSVDWHSHVSTPDCWHSLRRFRVGGEEMPDNLTLDDCRFILTSLEHTRDAFRNYMGYPSYEFKQQQMAAVNAVMEKVRAMRDALKKGVANARLAR